MNTRGESARGGLAPHAALVAVQLFFGTWPIFGKVALASLPSTGLVACRVAGATLVFAALRLFTRETTSVTRRDHARFAVFALLGVVLNQFFFVKGLEYSTVTNATLLGTAIPVFAMLISVVLGRERLSARKVLGALLAAAGVVFLIDPARADFSGGRTLGNVLLIVNAACYGAYLAVSQDTFRRYGALESIFWVFVFGSLFVLPIGGYHLAQAPLANVPATTWLVVAYIIVVPTVGAYYLNAWALERVVPSTVAVYIYLQPLIALALAPLVLGADEGWGPRTLLSALMIFAGVAVVTVKARSRAAEEMSERPEVLGR
ncbi:MAG TPA: DMT family transporter [Pyrinomonadaceae bacterium]|nr:DMT family transporter [Pyrinomonadaceae bacterium]